MSNVTTTVDVTTAPEVDQFPLGSWDRKPRRVIDFAWLVRTDDNGDRIVMELSCWHSDRKVFVASVNNLRMSQGNGFTSSLSAPMSSKRVLTEPVERYSKKAMLAFADAALGAFREQVEQGQHGVFLRGDAAVDNR